MQAKVRYMLVAVCAAITLFILLYGTLRRPGGSSRPRGGGGLWAGGGYRAGLSSYIWEDEEEDLQVRDTHISARARRDNRKRNVKYNKECRMENCFDFSNCALHGFKVYVYTQMEKLSQRYADIVDTIRTSRYYTSDPSEACLFVVALDTLDRDKLSTDDYAHFLSKKISSLSLWNNGQNHVVFNLYSGTWEHYYEDDLGFDPGKAILAKASLSDGYLRPGFDISYPLIGKDHPLKGGESGYLTSNTVPAVRKYMLSFKGKRYLVGIGSESRDALYHIHNGEDIVLLTTCQHGNLPKDKRDKKCKADEEEYDKWDFKTLLHNSTFCLVPRGRRLGSYRFLEALQAACVPVLLSNQWVLPFSEVIDWSKAAIWADERLLLQVPSIVRSMSHTEILSLRQHSQFLWDTYFSSTHKIVHTTLEVLKDRISRHLSLPTRPLSAWNAAPGGLAVLPEYSQELGAYPHQWGDHHPTGLQSPAAPVSLMDVGKRRRGEEEQTSHLFTAVIYCSTSSSVITSSSSLYRLVKNLAKSQYLHTILLLWHSDSAPPTSVRWPLHQQVQLHLKVIQSISERLLPYAEIVTSAVLSVDDDIVLFTDEADFAFHVWQHFPQRIVGYPSRTHYWDEARRAWAYTSKWTNDYSMVLTNAAIYHKYYSYLYQETLSSHPAVMEIIRKHSNCEDILMNFLVSHVTKQPPIKVAQRKRFKESLTTTTETNNNNNNNMVAGAPSLLLQPLNQFQQDTANNPSKDGVKSDSQQQQQSVWLTGAHFKQRQECMEVFTQHFGYMPLRRSEMRLDPLLYKDQVSVVRKKYRQLEAL